MVPHLVVQTEMGPVTVMVLVHESVAKPVPFEEQGYRGVIRARARPRQPCRACARPGRRPQGRRADRRAGAARHRLDGLT